MKKLFIVILQASLLFVCFAERRNALSLEGPWTYSFSYHNKGCNLRGDRVVNRSSYSRPFRLSLFLSKYPYSGGSIYGYEVGACLYNTLQNGYQYNDINLDFNYFRNEQPPSGVYYPVILVMEAKNGVYGIVDFLTFRDSMYFRNYLAEESYGTRYSNEVMFREYDAVGDGMDQYQQIAEGIEKIADSITKIIIVTSPPPPPPHPRPAPPSPRHRHRRPRPPRR